MIRDCVSAPRSIVRASLVAALCTVFLAVAGCGGQDFYSGEWDDQKEVAALVTGFHEALGKPVARERNFSAGVAPEGEQLEMFQILQFKPLEVKFSDENNAVVEVLVRDPWGSDIESIEWKAAKAGENWQLVEIPLPEIPPDRLSEDNAPSSAPPR